MKPCRYSRIDAMKPLAITMNHGEHHKVVNNPCTIYEKSVWLDNAGKSPPAMSLPGGKVMATITLPRNVHFVYEHALSHLEFTKGYSLEVDWDMTDPWTVTTSLNGKGQLLLSRSAYVGKVDDLESTYSKLVRPQYQGGKFNRTRSENQYLTHWIYPYKGKFHPQMIRAILNVIGAKPGWKVADVFSGAGTTLLECQLLGIASLGVEVSPLCSLLAKVKTQSWKEVDANRRSCCKTAMSGNRPPDR